MSLSRVEAKAAAKARLAETTAQTRVQVAQAESQQRLAESQASVQIERQRAEVARERAAADHAAKLEADRLDREAKQQRREAAQQQRDERRARMAAWRASKMDLVRGNVAGVASGIVYTFALGTAVMGQISAATSMNLPPIAGVGIAIFLEGMALAGALTAHRMRLAGEKAVVPRVFSWAAALIAATINFLTHQNPPELGLILGVASVSALVVWEVRSGANSREQLRAAGQLPEPMVSFGWRRWTVSPVTTARAWALDVRSRTTTRGAVLLAQAELTTTEKKTAKAGFPVVNIAVLPDIDATVDRPTATSVDEALYVPADWADLIDNEPVEVEVEASAVLPVAEPATGTTVTAVDNRPDPTPATSSKPKRRNTSTKPGKAKVSDEDALAAIQALPTDENGHVAVKAAARAAGIGVDRARRLLDTNNLLAPRSTRHEEINGQSD